MTRFAWEEAETTSFAIATNKDDIGVEPFKLGMKMSRYKICSTPVACNGV